MWVNLTWVGLLLSEQLPRHTPVSSSVSRNVITTVAGPVDVSIWVSLKERSTNSGGFLSPSPALKSSVEKPKDSNSFPSIYWRLPRSSANKTEVTFQIPPADPSGNSSTASKIPPFNVPDLRLNVASFICVDPMFLNRNWVIELPSEHTARHTPAPSSVSANVITTVESFVVSIEVGLKEKSPITGAVSSPETWLDGFVFTGIATAVGVEVGFGVGVAEISLIRSAGFSSATSLVTTFEDDVGGGE